MEWRGGQIQIRSGTCGTGPSWRACRGISGRGLCLPAPKHFP